MQHCVGLDVVEHQYCKPNKILDISFLAHYGGLSGWPNTALRNHLFDGSGAEVVIIASVFAALPEDEG